MLSSLQSRIASNIKFAAVLLLTALSLFAQNAYAQTANSGHGRILLVLPFENRSGQPSLEWVREAAPEILSARFASVGFAPMSRTDRMYALDHLGLPAAFHPSRATALKLAQTLDADSIIVGSYITDGAGIVAEAQVVDVAHLRMGPAAEERGQMSDLIRIFDALAWKLTRQMDPAFNGAEETFIAAGRNMRLDAFEQYVRGISEQDHNERLRHLEQAVKLSPDLSAAWMALAREDYNGQQYDQAALAFEHVARGDSDSRSADALEAGFYRGLSLLFSGNYPRAEQAFAGVARILPLAEVTNNQGVAVSRQHRDGTTLFREAVTADASSPDYHFNLAVSLKHHGANADATAELAQCLKLRPNDAEAQALALEWKSPDAKPQTDDAADTEDARPDPLERIAREFDAAAFRQAAQMLDQVDEAHLATLGPEQQAEKLASQAKDFLDHGLILEAERVYLSALAVDDRVASVHAGLAEVREKTGDLQNARKEARTSLELMPSVQAYLVMGRLNLGAGHLDDAQYDAGEALRIDAKSKAAQELKTKVMQAVGNRH